MVDTDPDDTDSVDTDPDDLNPDPTDPDPTDPDDLNPDPTDPDDPNPDPTDPDPTDPDPTDPDPTDPDPTDPDDLNPDQINADSNHTSARSVKRSPISVADQTDLLFCILRYRLPLVGSGSGVYSEQANLEKQIRRRGEAQGASRVGSRGCTDHPSPYFIP